MRQIVNRQMVNRQSFIQSKQTFNDYHQASNNFDLTVSCPFYPPVNDALTTF